MCRGRRDPESSLRTQALRRRSRLWCGARQAWWRARGWRECGRLVANRLHARASAIDREAGCTRGRDSQAGDGVATLALTMSQFYTKLDCCKSQFVYRHFGWFLADLEPAKRHGLGSVGGRLVAQAAIFLARGQVANAESRQVLFVALKNLHHRQVLILNLVLSGLHIFRVIVRGGDDRASLPHADAKLRGSRLVICIAKAVSDASAVDKMTDKGNARVRR